MAGRGIALALAGLLLGGCVHAQLEPSSEANFTQRDKKLLANAPYAKASIPTAYQRAIVQYHRKESPGSIVVDTDARYLYYVLPDNRAIRYGVIVGEEALSWYGIAKVGRKEEWPSWTPTADIKRRLDVPNFVEGGAHNPMGARGIYLYQANKDTLFRIHGTNQPEYIGQAISSGCIRMTNEDVIDLYNRVKMGSIVVVLAPRAGDAPPNPQVAAAGDPRLNEGAGGGVGRKSGAASFFGWPQAATSRSRLAQSSVRSSARKRRSNSSSISAGAMMSGGQIDKISPTMNLTISPSSSAKRTARGPTPDFGSNERLAFLSATSSTAPMSPRPRASPTSGCSPSAASRAWNCGALRAACSAMRSRA
jgi:lipoprotein-anchoring transpeptidase ErfK/SrfK